MLNILGNIFGALGGGAITGLIGTGLTAFIEYKKQKLLLEHEERKMKIEQETMKLEWEGKVTIADREAAAQENVAESEAFGKSFEADRARYLTQIPQGKLGVFTVIAFTIVDFVRGMTRPSLTAYLCGLTTWIAYEVFILTGGFESLSQTQAFTLLSQIIYVILYLTTTAVLWWLGTRNKLFKKTL